MTPVVYIDMLFLLNLFMDTIIIYASSLITRETISLLRLFLASVVLSVYSCTMFFPELRLFHTILGKVIILAISTIIAFPSRNIRRIIKNTLVFFTVSGIFGGILFALIFFTNFGTTMGAAVSNGEVYLDIKASTLLLSLSISYVAIYAISYIKRRAVNINSLIHNAEISLLGHSINIPIFADSGCLIRDPIKDRHSIILSKSASEKLIPSHIIKELSAHIPDIERLGAYSQRYCALPFSTIDKKSGIIHGFVPDSVTIDGKLAPPCVVAISDHSLDAESVFEGIFNPILLAEECELSIKTS